MYPRTIGFEVAAASAARHCDACGHAVVRPSPGGMFDVWKPKAGDPRKAGKAGQGTEFEHVDAGIVWPR